MSDRRLSRRSDRDEDVVPFDLRFVARHRHPRNITGLAGLDIEAPHVPRADDDAPVDRAFTEGTVGMGAGIVDGVNFAIDVVHGQRLTGSFDHVALAGGKIGSGHHAGEFGHFSVPFADVGAAPRVGARMRRRWYRESRPEPRLWSIPLAPRLPERAAGRLPAMVEESAQPPTGLTHELVTRIQAGDQDAWNDLYRRYHDSLLFAVRCRLGPGLRRHLQSEDILQSVVLEAMIDLQDFRPTGPESLRHFLHVMVANKIRDRVDTFGAKKRRGTVALTDSVMAGVPGYTGPPRYHDGERYERLEQCMTRLPEDMREVVLLRKVEGLTSREVAAVMKREDTAVRKLYSRALARLTSMMSGSEEPS